MTDSKSIAKVFTIFGYVFLIPASFLILVPTYLFFMFVSTSDFKAAIVALLGIAAYMFGVLLFVGYRKHSKGNLEERKIIPLWLGTLVFNISLILPLIYLVFQEFPLTKIWQTEVKIRSFGIVGAVFTGILIWQSAAIWLSIQALIYEARNDQKYR